MHEKWIFATVAATLFTLPATSTEARQQRSTTERHAFVKQNACPATGRNRLPCYGYQIDHIVPLCANGHDHRGNMQWLTIEEHKAKTRTDIRECRR